MYPVSKYIYSPSDCSPVVPSSERIEGFDYEKNYKKACELYNSKNYQEAITLLMKGQKIHVASIFLLACCYRDGTGVPQDLEMAVQLFQEAAFLGNPKALTKLGCFYFAGSVVPYNKQKAIQIWQKAFERGDQDALWYLSKFDVKMPSHTLKTSASSKAKPAIAKINHSSLHLKNQTAMVRVTAPMMSIARLLC